MSREKSPHLQKDALCTVIGSSGCLGRELVAELLKRGYRVNGFDTREPVIQDDRVQYFTGSLTERKDLLPALKDVDVVFQTASPQYFTKNKSMFHKVNVEGAHNVIQCCIDANVPRLVATSSGIVVFDGKDNCGKTEDELPYGTFQDAYQQSKIEMEKAVIAANGLPLSNGAGKLLTVAMRPQAIFGPGDSAIVPGLQVFKNWSAVFGPGTNTIDYTYTTNVAHGHILAAEKLFLGSPVCGEAFNISNDDPINWAEFTDKVLFALGYQPALRLNFIPVIVFTVIAHILLFIQSLFQSIGVYYNVPITPMAVMMSVKTQSHSIDKAKRLLGYRPLVSMTEGIQRLTQFYQEQRRRPKKVQ
ncbi:sterol-4-alpha-carboxylate 3-dehydrogenase, decarboxylating-like [Sycon ciliatum]|uniref:sterol-4-alpha-carboxylate 3-dehydrogenase, decarboxylating-like n=1 Tax=Sycon ciliatum TaxID=27933 RepID=UPI0031F6997B